MTKKPTLNNTHTSEFSRRAHSYIKYNIIQKEVVRKLMRGITSHPKKILDLGCGSGAVYNMISWNFDSFVGIDKASKMCLKHPRNKFTTILDRDFEDITVLDSLGHFDIIISSSALQWASDINILFTHISQHTDEIAFSIFCDGTFQSIYNMTKIKTFLPSSEILLSLLEKNFIFSYEIKEYKLFFPDNLSKFRYIKQSGVSGGKRKLSIKETKILIQNYPHDYLEFEVLFVWGKIKK